MNYRLVRTIALAIILAIALILIKAPRSEEDKVKRLIYSGKRAIEKEDLLKCSSYLSFDYTDEYGNDRRSLLFAAKTAFNDYNRIFINITKLEIEVIDLGALAEIEAVGYGQRAGTTEQAPMEYDEIKVNVRLKKEKKAWKVIELEFLESDNVLPFLKSIS
jgi:hypothetical protein